MAQAEEQSRWAWQIWQEEWNRSREVWNDTTADYFQAHFVDPMEGETQAFQRALESLLGTLRRARDEAR